MNLYTIILYIVIGGLFLSALYANISKSQTERQKILILYLIFTGTYLTMIVMPAYRDNPSTSIGLDFLAFGVMLPQFVARLINGRQIKDIVLRLKIDMPNLIFSLVAISFILFLTWRFLHPSIISFANGPIYDYEYFRTRISFLLSAVSGSIYLFMLAIERPAILQKGIFYKGLHWDWADFQSYTWEKQSNGSTRKLILQTKKIWLFPQVEFKMTPDETAQVESVLTKKVMSAL